MERRKKEVKIFLTLIVLVLLLIGCDSPVSDSGAASLPVLSGTIGSAVGNSSVSATNTQQQYMILSVDENGNTSTDTFRLGGNYEIDVDEGVNTAIMILKFPEMSFVGVLRDGDQTASFSISGTTSGADFDLNTDSGEITPGQDNPLELTGNPKLTAATGENGIDTTTLVSTDTQRIALLDFLGTPGTWLAQLDEDEDAFLELNFRGADGIRASHTAFYYFDSPSGTGAVDTYAAADVLFTTTFSVDEERELIRFGDPDDSGFAQTLPLNLRRGEIVLEEFEFDVDDAIVELALEYTFGGVIGTVQINESNDSFNMPILEIKVAYSERVIIGGMLIEEDELEYYAYLVGRYGAFIDSEDRLTLNEIGNRFEDISFGSWSKTNEGFSVVVATSSNVSLSEDVMPGTKNDASKLKEWLNDMYTKVLGSN